MQVACAPVRLDLFVTNRCVEGESHVPCLLRMNDVNGSVSGNAHPSNALDYSIPIFINT